MGDQADDVARTKPLDPRITISVMRQLVTLEKLGSVGAVARQLGLSQPTVSSNLSRFESVLGYPILVRTTTGTLLTGEGIAIASAARLVVDAAGHLAHTISERPGDAATPVRIAASLTIAEQLVPRWLADPHVAGHLAPGNATLVVGNSDEVMGWVQCDEVDIGFVEGNTVRPGLVRLPIAEDELVVIVGPSHRWFTRIDPISPHELVRGGLVIREDGSGTREVLENALTRAGVTLPTTLPTFGSTTAIVTAVRHGGAIAVVSRLVIDNELEEGKLHTLPIPSLVLTRRLNAVWHDITPPRADAAAFLRNVAKRARSAS